ncbi:MAG: DNA polymerase Y family protein, partial [Rubrivivax sp.]|nr:DNA polymerase Y family protein [Rubrivivax sp.]
AWAQATAAADSVLPLMRPAWLLAEPLPLHERNAVPLLEGRPLVVVSGPERIETGWWDGDPIARDYYIAQQEDGSLLWIYRSRLPVRAGAHGEATWHLHGRFG